MYEKFTKAFNLNSSNDEIDISTSIMTVYNSLQEKGYNPYVQIVGYLISGDPAYITAYNDARNIIKRFERDEILEELLKSYVKVNSDDSK